MKMNVISKTAFCTLAIAIMALTFIACDKDDDDEKDVPEMTAATSYDDLEFFQGTFVTTDTVGKFVSRTLGEPLYKDDTAHLYIGVETIEEALKYFESSIAPDITLTTSTSNNYTYNLTNADGEPQGTVTFTPGGEGGAIAEITTDAKSLKFFNKVTFIPNSAWPHNSAKGKYRLGDVFTKNINVGSWPFNGDYAFSFVCIRESGNGTQPIFVAITKEQYLVVSAFSTSARGLITSAMCPNLSISKTISDVIRCDFEFYKACFDEAGEGPLIKDELYWINEYHQNMGVYRDQGCINLSNGEIDYWDVTFHSPEKYVLVAVTGSVASLLDRM
ncbi:MAG: hypothetical protein J6X05_00490 [Bacteroidales bacterium]|nr:hypothetical protein [Bacteroidales bacterium]